MPKGPDYYIRTTYDPDREPYPWAWEIKRRGKPMGVRIGKGGYVSRSAAEFAGKHALKDFLDALTQEERRGG
jgi:hypothetical protein